MREPRLEPPSHNVLVRRERVLNLATYLRPDACIILDTAPVCIGVKVRMIGHQHICLQGTAEAPGGLAPKNSNR